MNIYEDLEILTVTFKSEHIIESCLSNIDSNFKVTVVENSNNLNFKKKMEERKNTTCILANENIGFGSAFNLGAKQISSKYILHINPDVKINSETIKETNTVNLEDRKEIQSKNILDPNSIDKKAKQFADFFNGEIVNLE